jgi:CubicO group peptidase (beta-lactamase class C family)
MERVSAEQLEQWVAEARQRWNVPGIAVGVSRAGEAISPETAFRIASISTRVR